MRKSLLIGLLFVVTASASLRVIPALSPKNSRRPAINSIQYIILHTTEGAAAGSLSKLRQRGEAHYLVTQNGIIYRIMQDNVMAKHAGRSMWNGRKNIDRNSIGIEVEGYHNQLPTRAQSRALASLLAELKRTFNVPDSRILTHSMVAYGEPNKWHKHQHRGRKRCGMLMATREVREKLNIGPAPGADPDVVNGKLRIADPYLFAALYGQDIVRGEIATIAVATGPGHAVQLKNERLSKLTAEDLADEESDSATLKEIGVDGNTAYSIAGSQYDTATTIYIWPNGYTRTGAELKQESPSHLIRLPKGTKVLVGYIYGGHVSLQRSALSIAKEQWSSPATYYLFPNTTGKAKLVSGDDVNADAIPRGTLILFVG